MTKTFCGASWSLQSCFGHLANKVRRVINAATAFVFGDLWLGVDGRVRSTFEAIEFIAGRQRRARDDRFLSSRLRKAASPASSSAACECVRLWL